MQENKYLKDILENSLGSFASEKFLKSLKEKNNKNTITITINIWLIVSVILFLILIFK